MKFDYQKLSVGDIITVQSVQGDRLDMVVTSLDDTRTFCIFAVGCDGSPEVFAFGSGPDRFGGNAEKFDTGGQTFNSAGYWRSGDTNCSRIVKMKRSWKMFTSAVKLEVGMRVKMKQHGKWNKGVVEATANGIVFQVRFADMITNPAGSHSSTLADYRSDGRYFWHDPKVAKNLHIRKYK